MCANSAAMNPPPTMTTRSGSDSIRITVSLVWTPRSGSTRSRPSMSSSRGRPPAAMTHRSAVTVTPVPVSRLIGPVNRASWR